LAKLAAGDGAPSSGPALSWARAAREAQASVAAVSLAEIREELAFSFVGGLSTLVPRTTDPLVARLREIGLEKQAVLLDQTARRADPAGRLRRPGEPYPVAALAV